MAPIPDRVLVVGLARSGRAAAAALSAAGSDVVGLRRRTPISMSAGSTARSASASGDDALLDGVELVVKSPGVPAEAPPVAAARARGIPVISEIELGARLLANPILGITGHEREDDDDGAARRDVRRRRGAGRGRRQHRPAADEPRRRRRRRHVGRLRALVVPARGRRHAPLPRSRCCSTSSPITSTGTASFEAYRDAKLRIFENQVASDVAIVPRGFGAVPGAGRRRRVRRRRRAARPSR